MTAASRVAVGAVVTYQRLLSPLLPSVCRFTPTCSEYARIAFEERGFLRGLCFAAWRLLRCHPFHPGGDDPPPSRACRA